MRLLKKVIKKIYHLIWFLSAFLLFSPRVNAAVNIDGANFVQASEVSFADNTNGYLTSVGSTWVEYGSYWRSGSSILTTGGNYGANVAFLSDVPFVQGHTYSVSFLIGLANGYAVTNYNSNSRICIAENIYNVFARYNQPGSFPCTTGWSSSTNTSYYFSDGQVAYQYAMLSFVFTAEFTSNVITFTYNSSISNESNHSFGGYIVEEISSQPLTQSQIQSAIQSSGLATANSVSQVQQSINQMQTDINTSSQNIINNNNNNTNNIINNQNENTDKEIDSQKVCDIYNLDNNALTSSGFLNSSGAVVSQYGGNYTSKYYPVNKGETYSLSLDFNLSSPSYCLYDSSKTLISCTPYNNNRNFSIVPTVDGFIRYSGNKSSGTTTFTGKYCKNGNQALNDSVNDLNDNIIDSSVDDSSSTLSDLESQLPTNSVISDLLLLPVRLLQAIVNSLGGSCSSFNLGNLYGTNLVMPCIDLPRYLGSAIWTFIDLVFSGMFILIIRKKFIQIWENITNLKGGANEVD